MPIWKIATQGPVRIHTIDLGKEGVLEQQLEDWLLADSSLLGEPLLIIGRQVVIPDVLVQQDGDKRERVTVRIKEGFDLESLAFAKFLRKAYGFFR